MSDPEHAFQELAHIFSSRDNKILEIEIIPPNFGPSLIQDGCSVGITKKALVQALPVARRLFFDRLMPMTEHDFRVALADKTGPRKLPNSVVSEVILLFDCEHLTACNWRKRRLLAAVTHGLNSAEKDRVSMGTQLLKTELTLLTTYLCSPLHRHTKSPTMWHHRLWVLKQLFRVKPCNNAEALLELQNAELGVVLRAGELHPKNYYAFDYMRQLHTLLADVVTDQPNWADKSVRSIINPVLDWCLAHPRDISGWIFGVYLLQNLPDHSARADAVARVLRFARDVGWDGESLWTFVDQTVSQFNLKDLVDNILGCGLQSPSACDTDAVRDAVPQERAWLTWLARAKTCWAVNGRSA